MTVLAVDTSGLETGVGLMTDSGERFVHVRGDRRSEDTSLQNIIEELLRQYSLKIEDISCCITGSGPGSFTGLRIGYSFLEGFALARKLPLVGYSSAGAAALGIPDASNVKAILGYAGRRECFCNLYDARGKNLLKNSVIPVSEIQSEVETLSTEPIAFFYYGSTELEAGFPYINFGAAEIVVGLLEAVSRKLVRFESFSVEAISRLEPDYVRAVNARTIAQRMADRSVKQ